MNSKKAQMQMSVGTIVTIVLLMTVLILGLVLVRTIFSGAKNAVDITNTQLTDQVNKFFAEDDKRRVVIYPQSKTVPIEKGKEGGFGFSIRNLKQEEGSFSYEVIAVEASCGMSLSDADDLISLGKKRSGIKISSGSSMSDAIIVKIRIDEATPLCTIRYALEVEEGGSNYDTKDVDILVEPN